MDVTLSGPVGYRRFVLPKICEANEGHEHNYDHATIVIRGRIRVLYSIVENGVAVEKESREFSSGEVIEIKAGVRHAIKALEENSVYLCVFAHRDFDGLVTQSYVGNAAAYT